MVGFLALLFGEQLEGANALALLIGRLRPSGWTTMESRTSSAINMRKTNNFG